MNGRLAGRTQAATKDEVLASLTNDELDQPANFGISQRDLSARRFIGGLGRHIRGHGEQFKAGL